MLNFVDIFLISRIKTLCFICLILVFLLKPTEESSSHATGRNFIEGFDSIVENPGNDKIKLKTNSIRKYQEQIPNIPSYQADNDDEQLFDNYDYDYHLKPKCEQILENSMCYPIMREFYTYTFMPNLLGHENQMAAEASLETFNILFDFKCSKHLKWFLCSAFYPYCPVDKTTSISVGPCRGLCVLSRDNCQPIMNQFGYSWPSQLDCDSFPLQNDNDNMCIEAFPETKEQSQSVVYDQKSIMSMQTDDANQRIYNHNLQENLLVQYLTNQIYFLKQKQQNQIFISKTCAKLFRPEAYVAIINKNSVKCFRKCHSDVLFEKDQKYMVEIVMLLFTVLGSVVVSSIFITKLIKRINNKYLNKSESIPGINSKSYNKNNSDNDSTLLDLKTKVLLNGLEQETMSYLMKMLLLFVLLTFSFSIFLFAGHDRSSCIDINTWSLINDTHVAEYSHSYRAQPTSIPIEQIKIAFTSANPTVFNMYCFVVYLLFFNSFFISFYINSKFAFYLYLKMRYIFLIDKKQRKIIDKMSFKKTTEENDLSSGVCELCKEKNQSLLTYDETNGLYSYQKSSSSCDYNINEIECFKNYECHRIKKNKFRDFENSPIQHQDQRISLRNTNLRQVHSNSMIFNKKNSFFHYLNITIIFLHLFFSIFLFYSGLISSDELTGLCMLSPNYNLTLIIPFLIESFLSFLSLFLILYIFITFWLDNIYNSCKSKSLFRMNEKMEMGYKHNHQKMADSTEGFDDTTNNLKGFVKIKKNQSVIKLEHLNKVSRTSLNNIKKSSYRFCSDENNNNNNNNYQHKVFNKINTQNNSNNEINNDNSQNIKKNEINNNNNNGSHHSNLNYQQYDRQRANFKSKRTNKSDVDLNFKFNGSLNNNYGQSLLTNNKLNNDYLRSELDYTQSEEQNKYIRRRNNYSERLKETTPKSILKFQLNKSSFKILNFLIYVFVLTTFNSVFYFSLTLFLLYEHTHFQNPLFLQRSQDSKMIFLVSLSKILCILFPGVFCFCFWLILLLKKRICSSDENYGHNKQYLDMKNCYVVEENSIMQK